MNIDRRFRAAKKFSLLLGGSLIALSLAGSPGMAAGSGNTGSDTIVLPPNHNTETSKANQSNHTIQPSSFTPGSWQALYSDAVMMIEVDQFEDAFLILASLDRPGNADILNYMGFTSRKMGQMEDAKRYYEAALAIDPNHIGVLEYYGEWHVRMGDFATARSHLAKIAMLCGVGCEEYRDLANAIAHPGSSAQQEW